MSVYFSKEKELSKIKQGLMDEAVRKLERTTLEHATFINEHKTILKELDRDLKYTNKSLVELREDLNKHSESTEKYIRDAEKRLTYIEVLSKNVALIKNRK